MRLRNIRGSKETIAASDYVVQEPETYKGTWGQLFGNEQPVQIEVGMGKGRFIMDMARLHPDRNFVGIEMYDSVLLRAANDVFIGEGSWIGEKVCILSGVSIGKKCIIGAGSVVTKSIPSYSIAAGNPAKVLKVYNFESKRWEKYNEENGEK